MKRYLSYDCWTVSLFIGFIYLSILIACNGGGGSNSPDQTPDQTGDFARTLTQEGTVGSEGSYSIVYYENAKPAQRQLKDDDTPKVLSQLGNLLILDITSWPTDWNIGEVILVRMPSGIVEYKRLITRLSLLEGRLAIGVEDASVMEVISNGNLSITGDLQESGSSAVTRSVYYDSTLSRSSSSSSETLFPNGLVDVVNYKDSKTIWILNENDMELYSYNDSNVSVNLSLPQARLHISPYIDIKFTIDKPLGVSNIIGIIAGLSSDISEATQDIIGSVGGMINHDRNGDVVTNVGTDEAKQIIDYILAVQDVAEKIESIYSVLHDKDRIKEARLAVSGSVDGNLDFSAAATSQYSESIEQELAFIVVPIAGPIPIFLQFDLVSVASLGFDGQINITTGVQVNSPFSTKIEIINGEIQPMTLQCDTPSVSFDPPSFDGTRASLRLSAGIQVESGLSIAKLLSATVDPTVEMIFDTNAALTGTPTSGCADLDWDIYAQFRTELEAELSLIIMQWQKQWDTPFTYTLLKEQPPSGFNQFCWDDPIDDSSCVFSLADTLPIPQAIISHLDSGLEHDGDYLWAPVNGSAPEVEVYKIDPVDGSITVSYPQNHYNPGSSNVKALACDTVNNIIYNYVFPYGPIYAVDTNTLTEIPNSSISAPASWIHDIAYDSAQQILWAVTGDSIKSNFRIYKINPGNGAVLGSFTSPANTASPAGLTWDGTYLWISESSNSYLYRVDPIQALSDGNCDNAIINEFYLPDIGAPAGRLAWDGQYLWTHSRTAGFFYKIDTCNAPSITTAMP